MDVPRDVAGHYASGDLLERLRAALLEDGADPDNPTIPALAPYDHFHGGGLEATVELAGLLAVSASDHILDIGSGIGGPARYISDRFGCRVTGIDLTAEFCAVARYLNALLGLEDRVSVHEGDALAMPFDGAALDGAYSMNVSMNIADRDGLYREIHRVLKPGGWLVLSEVAQGSGGDIDYPTPWANHADASFLATPTETEARLTAAGFIVEALRDVTDRSLEFGARSRAAVERGEKPPHRAVTLIHGEDAMRVMSGNMSRAMAGNCILPIEVRCRKPG